MIDDIAKSVLARTGLADTAAAEWAVHASIRALGSQLPPEPRERLFQHLPVEAGRELSASGTVSEDPDAFYAELASAMDVRVGVALEVAQTVLAEVSDRAGPALRAELRRALPEGWASLIVEPRPQSTWKPAPASAAPGTLASGRPGGTHPLADSAPEDGHAESISRADDPHHGSTIASADE